MSGYLVPNTDALSEMLTMLYGSEVDATESACLSAAGNYAASFVNDDGALVALCLADFDFVAFSGSALSMMPVGGAKDMIAEKDPSKTVLDNFCEVMNLCSSLFMSDHTPHLRLKGIHSDKESDALLSTLGGGQKRVGYSVDISRYGKGSLSFLAN